MLEDIKNTLSKHGLLIRGGFNEKTVDVEGSDLISSYTSDLGINAKSLVMVGVAGSEFWTSFKESQEFIDGKSDPLDRWSKRIGDIAASEFNGYAVYPSDGPPYYPFIQWAKQCETVHTSKMGFSIHSEFGLWHAFRFALLFPYSLEGLSEKVESDNPCNRCINSPCLSTCPVDAYTINGFDADKCYGFLKQNENGECRTKGCIARRSCPEGSNFKYMPEHAEFHMTAFYDSQKRRIETAAEAEMKGNNT